LLRAAHAVERDDGIEIRRHIDAAGVGAQACIRGQLLLSQGLYACHVLYVPAIRIDVKRRKDPRRREKQYIDGFKYASVQPKADYK
jgi:hypothetical protein